MTGVRSAEFTSADVCRITGINYGRIDHWCRTGLLHETAVGSGSRRGFTFADVRVAVALATLAENPHHRSSAQEYLRVRELVANAVYERPASEFVVVLDGAEVSLCDTAVEVVAAARRSVVATVIRLPDVKLSAESETSGASAAPSASRPSLVASAASVP